MAHENATPRPWFVGLSNNGQVYSVVAFDRDVATLTRREAAGTAFKGEPSNADAKLIVEAVNSFDTLRAEVDRLEAENAKIPRWQLIETAPAARLYLDEDPVPVLLCNESEGPHIGHVSLSRDGTRRGLVGGWHGTTWTHWHPMPARVGL